MPIAEKRKLYQPVKRWRSDHDARKGPRLIGKREIDQHNPRRGRRFSAADEFDAAHGLGNEVDKRSVLRRALAALRRPEHRPHMQRPGQRRLTVVDLWGKEMRSQPPISASVADRSSGASRGMTPTCIGANDPGVFVCHLFVQDIR